MRLLMEALQQWDTRRGKDMYETGLTLAERMHGRERADKQSRLPNVSTEIRL